MDTLQGKLLIASRRLGDSNFARSVLLIVQHDDDGALGVILNRPLDLSLGVVCEKATGRPCERQGHVYMGGPCEGPLMAVHTQQAAAQIDVLPAPAGLYFSTERHDLEWLLEQSDDTGPARFFAGYAGWSAGQLEGEREEGSWFVLPATRDHIFTADHAELWPRLIQQATFGRLVREELLPDDPSTN